MLIAFGSLARAQECKERVFQVQLHEALNGKVVIAKYERASERIVLLRSMACDVKYVHVCLLQECEGVRKGWANDRDAGSGRIEAFFNTAYFVLNLADARPSASRAAFMDKQALDVASWRYAEATPGSQECRDAVDVRRDNVV
jgi:hypothetical protein